MLARIRAARENESGFTLIELLIVIVILGVLSGIVIFSVSGITDRGEKAACATDLKSVQVASEAFYAQSPTRVYAAGWADLVPGFLQTEPTTVSYLAGATAKDSPTISAAGSCVVAP